MVKPIVRDQFFLAMKSEPASREDIQVAADLEDTLKAHAERCVGLSANMIGVRKRIMVVSTGIRPMVVINPVIIGKSGPFEVEEGCLSMPGTKRTVRYASIEVNYQDKDFVARQQVFQGLIAQIIQHEMDHFEGRLI